MSEEKQNKERRILVRLTEDKANEFIEYCNENGFTMSKRLRLLIEKDMEGKLEIKK